ncbi:MAG: phosphate ABC transporter ATP-binding protein [Chlorobiaceae bacterium]|nr:phosphate ABC transporter ATP-binding protein PstB [Chlorobiales bacterium]NTU91996.1 phosphate ABC transporter ATP-binding protein [Chlorobiaceae bacterium]NTV25405.1 phosphate ABC transporter ATP-binding protein [Chlorobiaceae bacterium]
MTASAEATASKTVSVRDIYLPPERKKVAGGGVPHVSAKNFSIYYGEFEAVKKVSADIPSKYVTAIIGPSGCGKSTFLRSINRMNDLIPNSHTTGSLMFDGQDVYSKFTDEVLLRKKIGMVFQKPNPFPKSIFDNIAYGPRLHGIRDRKTLADIVEKSLRKAALWDEVCDRLDKNALGMSGGQQQRLCFARTLAVEPEILLLDEPTSALDPRATAKIEDLIQELRGSYTIMIVTHNMQQASRVSDNTMFFYEGTLVEFAPTAQLFTNPKNSMTEDYITGRFS